MKKNRQKSTESTPGLSPEQLNVISALVGGASVTDAAKQANIDRSTYYLWLKTDPIFQAELNRAKRELEEARRAQLWGLFDQAVSTIREGMSGTDIPTGVRVNAALAVLRVLLGTLKPENIGATDPEAIERAQREQERIDEAAEEKDKLNQIFSNQLIKKGTK